MIQTRFAPPLTGHLSVGNARIALANFLHARRHGGRFVLRLDDIDQDHAKPEIVEAVVADVRWLGIELDAIIRQSERLALYGEAAERLKQAGRLYPCFESEEELRAKRERRGKRGEATVYDRAMLKLSPARRAGAEAGGKRPYWRFLLSDGTVEWDDVVLGHRVVKLPTISDPVVISANGTPLPVFTAIVDDIDVGVTALVRNDVQLAASAIAIDMMAAMGADPLWLRLAHLAPMSDAASRRPSRRFDVRTLRSLRREGIEAKALVGWLARLGTSEQPEARPLARLAATFDLVCLSPDPIQFDLEALLALNRAVLRGLDFTAVADRLPGGATERFWLAVRGSLDLLGEVRGWWDVVTGTIVPPETDEPEVLIAALDLLPPEPWHPTIWQDWMDALAKATGRSRRTLARVLRLALTGEEQGPDLRDLLPLIGRTRTASRLQVAAA